MDNPKKLSKANGHIVQVDWNETEPTSFSYIHNKPEIPSINGLATEAYVQDQINSINSGTSVTVGGVHQETFNADNKLDKPENLASSYYKVIAANSTKTTTLFIDNSVAANVINQKSSGNVIVTYRNQTAGNTLSGYQKVLISGEPVAPSHVATKNYVDTNINQQIALNRTQSRITTSALAEKTVSFSDCYYTYEVCYQMPDASGTNTAMYSIRIDLNETIPANTEVHISASSWITNPRMGGTDHASNMGYEASELLLYNDAMSSQNAITYTNGDSDVTFIAEEDITCFYIVDTNCGVPYEYTDGWWSYGADQITVTYLSGSNELANLGGIDLYSNTELHYDIPIAEIRINSFIESYPSDVAQTWTLSFIAGDSDPVIILPDSSDCKIRWQGAEPIFSAYTYYYLTFKKIRENVYLCAWSSFYDPDIYEGYLNG